MTHIFTKDNITFALSIFGSLGTLFTLIHKLFSNRKHLQMKIIHHILDDDKRFIIYASFVNKSMLPISITNICIKIDDVYYPCMQPPVVACEETTRINGRIVSYKDFLSLPMPINLPPLSGSSGYICFEFSRAPFQPDSKELIFSVSSNRGKVFEKKLSLGRPFD